MNTIPSSISSNPTTYPLPELENLQGPLCSLCSFRQEMKRDIEKLHRLVSALEVKMDHLEGLEKMRVENLREKQNMEEDLQAFLKFLNYTKQKLIKKQAENPSL